MSEVKDSGVGSMGADKGSVLDDLNRSRMEVQWLKWELNRLSAELEAVKKGSQPEVVSEAHTPKERDMPRCKGRLESRLEVA